ncbi:MAG: LysM peptidoglycan-binding domain-containing protein, partial [Smithella sp.]
MKRRISLLAVLFLLSLSLGFATGASAKQYVVKKGENLKIISKKTGVSIQEIQKVNGFKGTALKTKQVLIIPEKAKASSSSRTKAVAIKKSSKSISVASYT